MKKIIVVFLSMCLMYLIVGCGVENESSEKDLSPVSPSSSVYSDGISEESKEQLNVVEDEVKIEDINWNVREGTLDGIDTLIFEYTNNSSVVIADVEMNFKQKANLSEDEKSVLDSLKKKYDWTEEEISELYIMGYNRKLADPGETVTDSNCVFNGSFLLVDKIDYYNLMEPDNVSIAYIGSDNMIHILYYDFASNTYNEPSDNARPIYEWENTELSNLLPKPDLRVVAINRNDDEAFRFEAYGVSEEDYASYVDECKKKGFTISPEEKATKYEAENSDDFEINVIYTKNEEKMSCKIEK